MFKVLVPAVIALAVTAGAQTTDITLEKAWQIQSDDEQVYGLLIDAVRGQDGNYYLLDSSLSQVHVLDEAGQCLCTFGREGAEGPGNFSGPRALLFLEPDVLAVVQQRALEALVPFRLEHGGSGLKTVPAEKIPMPDSRHGRFAVLGARGTDGPPVFYGMNHDFVPAEKKVVNHFFLVSQGKDSTCVYFHQAYSIKPGSGVGEEILGEILPRWTVFADGRVALWDETAYSFELREHEGELIRRVMRSCGRVKRTSEQKEFVYDLCKGVLGSRAQGIPVEVRRDHPAILRSFALPDGRLLVLTSEAIMHPDGHMRDLSSGIPFDVFDSKGLFLGVLRLKGGNIDPVGDGLHFFEGSLLVIHGVFDSFLARAGLDARNGSGDQSVQATLYRM